MAVAVYSLLYSVLYFMMYCTCTVSWTCCQVFPRILLNRHSSTCIFNLDIFTLLRIDFVDGGPCACRRLDWSASANHSFRKRPRSLLGALHSGASEWLRLKQQSRWIMAMSVLTHLLSRLQNHTSSNPN